MIFKVLQRFLKSLLQTNNLKRRQSHRITAFTAIHKNEKVNNKTATRKIFSQ